MHDMYIQVYAFYVTKIIILHLHIYAFPVRSQPASATKLIRIVITICLSLWYVNKIELAELHMEMLTSTN